MWLRSRIGFAFSVALLAASVAASASPASTPDPAADTAKDMAELPAFVAARPTPEEFQQAFPDVWLILPGDIVSRDVCSQYYRFIAELDPQGRISGGSLE